MLHKYFIFRNLHMIRWCRTKCEQFDILGKQYRYYAWYDVLWNHIYSVYIRMNEYINNSHFYFILCSIFLFASRWSNQYLIYNSVEWCIQIHVSSYFYWRPWCLSTWVTHTVSHNLTDSSLQIIVFKFIKKFPLPNWRRWIFPVQ